MVAYAKHVATSQRSEHFLSFTESFKGITKLQSSLKQIKQQRFTRKDKSNCGENGFVHYHCTKCDFVTRKVRFKFSVAINVLISLCH